MPVGYWVEVRVPADAVGGGNYGRLKYSALRLYYHFLISYHPLLFTGSSHILNAFTAFIFLLFFDLHSVGASGFRGERNIGAPMPNSLGTGAEDGIFSSSKNYISAEYCHFVTRRMVLRLHDRDTYSCYLVERGILRLCKVAATRRPCILSEYTIASGVIW